MKNISTELLKYSPVKNETHMLD